jgi:hypothetical protein
VSKQEDRSRALTVAAKAAAGAVGTVVGVGASSAVGPLAGTVIGAMAGAAFDDMMCRKLSERERARVASVMEYATHGIKAHWANGDDLRDDGFFEADPMNRSFFEEIAEGTMLAAQRDHEERKLPYIGNLLANVAFASSEIDRVLANWALRTAHELSWTQFRLLASFGRSDITKPDLKMGSGSDWPSWAVHQELISLGDFQRGLVGRNKDIAPSKLRTAGLPTFETNISRMALTSGGNLLYWILSLELMPEAEILCVLEALKSEGEPTGVAAE